MYLISQRVCVDIRESYVCRNIQGVAEWHFLVIFNFRFSRRHFLQFAVLFCYTIWSDWNDIFWYFTNISPHMWHGSICEHVSIISCSSNFQGLFFVSINLFSSPIFLDTCRGKLFLSSHTFIGMLPLIWHPEAAVLFGMPSDVHLPILLCCQAIPPLVISISLYIQSQTTFCWSDKLIEHNYL